MFWGYFPFPCCPRMDLRFFSTLLFLYLRPQQTAPQQFLPVWPDYSELSISRLLDDLREVLIPRGDVPPKRTLMIQVVR
jgi:hypothetical protein